MDCRIARDNMGALLDGELSAQDQTAVQRHLSVCRTCAAEFEELRLLSGRFEGYRQALDGAPPAEIWAAIEASLRPTVKTLAFPCWFSKVRRHTVALAASLGLLIGGAVLTGLWIRSTEQTASADVINYGMLLDHLPDGIDKGFHRFLEFYRAERIDAASAPAAAPDLSFELPAHLPSGHALKEVYRLRFENSVGIAARYDQGGQALIVFFHPPVAKEEMGTHEEMPCLIGSRHGHEIKVGSWRLVHFTDPSTCHCVLSTLSGHSELSSVFRAIAPLATDAGH